MTDNRTDLVTTEWELGGDELFQQPFIDVDEWRDAPVRHRYVHGGFRGTDTLFSFYFPETQKYERRFFQHVTPVPQSENLGPELAGEHNKIDFANRSGAYFVETNGGGPDAANPFSGLDPTIGAYRANAAAALFSRVVAASIFGEHRPYGYLYGGSGGAYRTIGASENTEGVWDGFVPYVPGSPMSIPNVFSVRMHAQRILRHKFTAIVDAYDVGGDPDSLDLTPEEAAALAEVTRMGFPPRSWFGYETMGMHAFSVLYPGVMAADPSYADDFWTVDGYLGADPNSSVHRDRVRLDTSITELIGRQEHDGDAVSGGVDESYQHTASAGRAATALRLAETPTGWMLGAQFVVRSGAAAASTIRVLAVEGDTIVIEPGQDAAVLELALGDEVTLDNSTFLAAQTYHRHQVPGPEYSVWDQFRDAEGTPIYPQRPMLLGPMFTQATAGTVPSGRITGKMIAVASLLDREAFPWQADWYRSRVEAHLAEDASDRFRLWFTDNALHGDDLDQEFPDRTVTYLGALEAALRQLAAWVENRVEPSPNTSYDVVDGQVLLPPTAAERGGIQPVPTLSVNGAPSARVKVGEMVAVRLDVETPSPGIVVEVIADFDGTGTFDQEISVAPSHRVSIEHETAFDSPGTRFIAVRVTAQVDGARVQNLARARIEVVA